MNRFLLLQANHHLLKQCLRGIEREALRVDRDGRLAQSRHPKALGSALTHPHITTDYSEALLELITGTHENVDSMMTELKYLHQFVLQNLPNESLWMQSMPPHLPDENDIPIAWYGTSNSGMLKYVYRRGLAERYGRAMQCISGLHYNFSFPTEFWSALQFPGKTKQEQQNNGYLATIRNFHRYSWILIWLFGCTPAINRSFLPRGHSMLKELDQDTLYIPQATSLRMSDLGYQNKAQSGLNLCYNSLENFTQKLYDAISQSWPEYEKIGTHRDGEWIQLNTNILQIENEFYAAIRPKQTTQRGERPLTALIERGIQYLEVRCLDIDPTQAIGIDPNTCYFVETFLTSCAIYESPEAPFDWHNRLAYGNFANVVKAGQNPNLLIHMDSQDRPIFEVAKHLIDIMRPIAHELDKAMDCTHYTQSLERQYDKCMHPETLPSARLIQSLHHKNISFFEDTLRNSQQLSDTLRNSPIPQDLFNRYQQQAQESLEAQKQLEANDQVSFENYVANYNQSVKSPYV